MKELEVLFEQYTGVKAEKCEELPSSGSNRRYFRLQAGNNGKPISIIGAFGTSVDENKAFITIDRHFLNKGLPVPKVLAVSDNGVFYIQEDLGDVTLFNTVASGRESGSFSVQEKELLKRTVALLPRLQFEGGAGLDYSVCYPQPEFDERMISFDLNYFKYCFLKTTGLEIKEIDLYEDFKRFTQDLLSLSVKQDVFMYRDFQARNVMLRKSSDAGGWDPYFIDFQGGRKGPFYYDLASFVWQAKANYPDELKEELVHIYMEALKPYVQIGEEKFRKNLRLFLLFRTMQVLGAYGFRGYFEKKPHFLQSIPYAMDNLRKLLAKAPFVEYPYLNSLLTELSQMRQFNDLRKQAKLVVKIFSFAYKKGIPADDSGNGGGYVFDCRDIENPGKYDHFKHFTGLDSEVIKFLEENSTVGEYLGHVYELADAHVKKYIERKFTSLMFSFGCTGGQHRSVYCAEHLAAHISKRFNVSVVLVHRELGINKEY
ncbi:MAG: phosphotransferase [Bacteroidales bacterium]|nr:phosphotransferase [Bacteroidales bacterium]